MADTVFWNEKDALGRSNLAQFLATIAPSGYVEEDFGNGMVITPDWANDTIDVDSGACAVRESGEVYVLFPDARADLNIADNDTNYLYVHTDPTTDNDITYTVKQSQTPPTNPSLYLAEVVDNGSSGEVNKKGYGRAIKSREVTVDQRLGVPQYSDDTQPANDTLYYDTTDNQLEYKNSSGTIEVVS